MLLYIHGFNSSPLSEKAKLTADFVKKHYPQLHFEQPQMPNTPTGAMALLTSLCETAIKNDESLAFIGSSLGGYLSSYLVEKYGGKAVLINPAVKPYELFADLIGEQVNPFTHERYEILPEYQLQLKQIDTQAIRHPDRFFVLLQTGDEVLDYRQALEKYHCCEMVLEHGGNHGFENYAQHLHDICDFLQIG